MLERALKSVFSQTYKNWELIVVDDNDPDSIYRKRTELLIEKQPNDKKIKYLKNNRNRGSSFSRNKGIRKTKGEWIAFLDDDCEWMPHKLKKQLDLFQHSDIDKLGVIYCNMLYIDKMLRPFLKTDFTFRGNRLERFVIQQRGIGTSLLLVKSEIFERIKGFPKTWSEQDFILETNIISQGYGFDFCKDILAKSYIHEHSRISNSDKKIEGITQSYEESKKYFHLLNVFQKMSLCSEYQNKLSQAYARRKIKIPAIRAFTLSVFWNPIHFYKRKVLFRIFLGEKAADVLDKIIRKLKCIGPKYYS